MRCVFLLCLFLTTIQGCPKKFRKSTQPRPGHQRIPESKHESVPELVMNKGVEIPLKLINNKVLVGRVTVGNAKASYSPQVFYVHMDITSPMVILLSGKICKKRDCKKLKLKTYYGDRSMTYCTGKGRPWAPQTGEDFVVHGLYATDWFKFDTEYGTIGIKDQLFLEADQIKKAFPGYDGVFGLALMTGNSRFDRAPVHTMATQFTDVEPFFGIYINKIVSPFFVPEVGSLILGGGDEKFYKKETLHSHDVKSTANNLYIGWYINVQRVQIKPKTGEPFKVSSSVQVAIPAPDVEYVLLPEEIKKTFFDKVFESVGFSIRDIAVPCNTNWFELPKLVFIIDGQEYTLTAEDYVKKKQVMGSEFCVLGIGSHSHVIHLGRVFMTKFYTRFDVKNKQIQFAESKPRH